MDIEKIKRELLEETNYRCGYCMKNVTPRMYYINSDPTKPSPVFDYTYKKLYSVHDRAHIEPNSKVEDDFKDYYNLITLCKQCHWEIDKPGMLDIKHLKKQKLYWIIASGKFTKIEIDCLFQLYYSNKNYLTDKMKVFYPSAMQRLIEPDGSLYNKETLGEKKVLYFLPVPRNLLIFFHNIVQIKFARIIPEITKAMYVTSEPGSSTFINHELYLTEQGFEFCNKFNDVYEE